jgi:hypothetical protein
MDKESISAALAQMFSGNEITKEQFDVLRKAVTSGFVLDYKDDVAFKELMDYDGEDYRTALCKCFGVCIMRSYTLRFGDQ